MTSAALELRDQNTAWAYSEFLQCLNTPLGAADSQVVGFCLERLSDLGQWKEAVVNQKSSWPVLNNLFAVALEGITYMDVHCSRAQCMLRLGDLAKKRGEISTAIEFWKSARRLFERSLQLLDQLSISNEVRFDVEEVEEAEEEIGTDVAKAMVPIVPVYSHVFIYLFANDPLFDDINRPLGFQPMQPNFLPALHSRICPDVRFKLLKTVHQLAETHNTAKSMQILGSN
ncbi:hypothetical protein C8J57DRAFT_1247740 [Mycena rebaudengoi]|nr:hypothetical protein C8J57DRAFT_1247740 [Mycena rebaudengoi]